MHDRPDHLRVGSFHVNNITGEVELVRDVQLCAGMQVYAYTITARASDALVAAGLVPEVLVEWKMQDSSFQLPSFGCALASDHADLPGLLYPASSKLVVPIGIDVWLHLTYGQCKRHVP